MKKFYVNVCFDTPFHRNQYAILELNEATLRSIFDEKENIDPRELSEILSKYIDVREDEIHISESSLIGNQLLMISIT